MFPSRPASSKNVASAVARRVPLAAALVTLLTFTTVALVGGGSLFALATASTSNELLRDQESLRETLRLIIDEETGVRGYTSTGLRSFLAPYRSAREHLDGRFTTLRFALVQLHDPQALNVFGTIATLHARWLNEAAAPLIGEGGAKADVPRQLLGKQYMDAIRSNFEALQDVVNDLAIIRQQRLRVLVGCGIAAMLVLFAIAVSAIVRAITFETIVHAQRERARTFLARCGDTLFASTTPDTGSAVAALTTLAVEEMADFCTLYHYGDAGSLRCAALAHRDPNVKQLFEAYNRKYPTRLPEGVRIVATTGDSLRFEKIPPSLLGNVSGGDETARNENADRDQLLKKHFVPGSALFVPLRVDRSVVGVLVLVNSISSRVFSQADLEICEIVARRTATVLGYAQRYRREELVATTLQDAALPASLPQVDGFVFSALYAPGKSEAHVGGDWYDVFVLDDGRAFVSIGDVAGSGLQAAVIMMSARQWLRALANCNPDPATVLAAADRTLRSEYPDAIATAFVAVLDGAGETLAYASAGHPAPLVRYADGTIDALATVGLPLGIREAGEPASVTLDLSADSLIVMYTDGLIESTRDVIEGELALRAAVAAAALRDAAQPAQWIHDSVLTEGRRDDVAILTVRVHFPTRSHGRESQNGLIREDGNLHGRWTFDVRDAACARAARSSVVDFLTARGATNDDCLAAEIVYNELIGNVLRHATGPADVQVHWSGHYPVLHVIDEGPGFQTTPALPADVFAESGRGLFVVSSLSETFSAEQRHGGNGSHCRAVLSLNSKRLRQTARVPRVTGSPETDSRRAREPAIESHTVAPLEVV